MELTYPLIIYIGIVAIVVSFGATLFSSKKYRGGRKVADAEAVRKIPRFKFLLLKYDILKFFMMLSLVVSLILALFIATKPTIVRTTTTEKHYRDLFICFDVSTSLDGVNIEMCEELKDFVKELKGERFGISIFNAKSVLIVPLTSDYDYIISMINTLERSIKAGENVTNASQVEDFTEYGYRFSGTLSNRGSSLIGDGLATCLYDFPDLKEEPDKSRLIVFVTDNDVQGECVVDIEEACSLCKKNGVKVFALAPDFVVDEENFKNAINSTGGYYYNTRNNDAMEKMLEDVKKTDVSTTYFSITKSIDVPEKALIALVVSLLVYFGCAWGIKS